MLLSERINAIKPSATLTIAAKAQQLRAAGRDIINMGVGEPDFDTPAFIKEAAVQALAQGATKYTTVDGTLLLKQAIQQRFQLANNLHYDLNQIIVSNGAKQAIFNLCFSLLNPGDEVIIPAPYWVSYIDIARAMGAVPKVISTRFDDRFILSAEDLAKNITAKTKLLILNSPSNPTGVLYSKEQLEALGKVLAQYPQIIILSDDIYEQICWSQQSFYNIAMVCPELAERTVVINGVSKAYAMTGWRIGYAAGPVEIIAAMKKTQEQSTSCASSLSQAAATAALLGTDAAAHEMVQAYQRRLALLSQGLAVIPDVRAVLPDGAFYYFVDMNAVIKRMNIQDDIIFCERALNEIGVAMVPGSAFGAPGWMRLSFALSDELLQNAVKRLVNYCGAASALG